MYKRGLCRCISPDLHAGTYISYSVRKRIRKDPAAHESGDLLVKYMHFNTIRQSSLKLFGDFDIVNYTVVVHLTNFKVRIMNKSQIA